VSLSGLYYPLDGLLTADFPLGVSNRFTEFPPLWRFRRHGAGAPVPARDGGADENRQGLIAAQIPMKKRCAA
jgi:hypothetical protein